MLENIMAVVIIGGLMGFFIWFGTEDKRKARKAAKEAEQKD